jgi:leucyl aminopeptidase (aminopeptidase T)
MLDRITKVLIEEMFKLSVGETVAITIDDGTDMDIAKALFNKVKSCGGLPMIIHIPVARGDSEAGMPDWPVSPLTAALSEVDIWIEMNSVVLLYSNIWETAMRENKKLRYLIIGSSTIKSLDRIFCGYDIVNLGKLLRGVMQMATLTKKVRVTSKNGTDVSYLTDPAHSLDIDDGDYSKPIFGTAPGYVNIVPKVGSMNGRIVFDQLQFSDILNNGEHLEFIMEDGEIQEVKGAAEAEKFKLYLSSFDDPNMYKISHHMIGLNPNVKSLVGEIVEDERIWGGVDFGFGHTSPIDMPPHGQVAKSHFDGIVACTTIYFDEVKIVEDGVVCHPELVPFAEALLTQTA